MAKGQLKTVIGRLLQLSLRGMPVFLYHGLTSSGPVATPPHAKKYWVSAGQFEKQLHQVRQEGCRSTLLGELWNTRTSSHPEMPQVVFTFDDGRSSDYRIAYPILLEAGFRADFFVNTSTIGREGYLNWQEIAEMRRFGMSFQSHSHDHVDLVRLSPDALRRQLNTSKRVLEERLSCGVEFLSVPHGRWDGRVLKAAQQAGYRAVCNSRGWTARPNAPVINRVAVYAHTTAGEFRGLLRRVPLPYVARSASAAVFYLPKHVLLYLSPAQLGVRVLEEGA